MAKKTADIEPVTTIETRAAELPANVQALLAKLDGELAKPGITPARRQFLETRRKVHTELHDVFRRLA